jgi:hypothetical protein
MPRSRRSAKAAGSTFERQIADHFRDNYCDMIDRRVKTGSADKGDLANVRTKNNNRIVAELKNVMKIALGPWAKEAEVERQNDGAMIGIVVHKRHGTADPGQQWVTLTVDSLIKLMKDEK